MLIILILNDSIDDFHTYSEGQIKAQCKNTSVLEVEFMKIECINPRNIVVVIFTIMELQEYHTSTTERSVQKLSKGVDGLRETFWLIIRDLRSYFHHRLMRQM